MSEPLKTSERCSDGETAAQLLNRHFSTTPATFALSSTDRFNNIDRSPSPEQGDRFKVIGSGSCGTVFKISGTETVWKKCAERASVLQDHQLTNVAFHAAQDAQVAVQLAFPSAAIPRIPHSSAWVRPSDDGWWNEERTRSFPPQHRTREHLVMNDRIPHLPKLVRDALIELYFSKDEEIQQAAKDDPENKDCLVRVYLGERETRGRRGGGFTSLRDFEMRLNMMEDLRLDVPQIATEMAIGLAILHWSASIDARGTEFVLGSSATRDIRRIKEDKENHPNPMTPIHPDYRDIHLWMLDFDKATIIEMTEEDVSRKLVPAFMENDPYFPMPNGDEDDELWEVFSAAYLKAGVAILRAQISELVESDMMVEASKIDETLPKKFLEGVIEQVKKNEDTK